MNIQPDVSASSADPRIAFFNGFASVWDRDGSKPAEAMRGLLGVKERLGIRPGDRVLELGCGTGQITQWLADQAAPGEVVAADFSPGMLAQAAAKRISARFRELDICAAPVPEMFDLILCHNSFPHFRDKAAALRNLGGSLRPNGRLVILHFMGRDPLNGFHQKCGGPVGNDLIPAEDEWPALLGQAGLTRSDFEDRPDLFWLEAQKSL